MPEGLEAEIWRRSAESLIGRTIEEVWVDARCAPGVFVEELPGATIAGLERVGKVVLLRLGDGMRIADGVRIGDGMRIGLHFGMTGRLVIDGAAPIERLEYASGADRPEWDRFRLWAPTSSSLPSVPALRMNDPRRLGRISVNPDLRAVGPDALTLSSLELGRAIAGRRAAIKTLLLQPRVVAGLGNLCADEVLLHAGVAPASAADQLGAHEIEAIAAACRSELPAMLERGGSTHGALDPARRAAPGSCPLDGHPLRRDRLGGRTAVWCPHHQH